MHGSAGWVEFFADKLETEAEKHFLRSHILRMVSGEDSVDVRSAEAVTNNRSGGFLSQSLSPERPTQMKAEFRDPWLVGTQSAATDMLTCAEKKQGPILDSSLFLVEDLMGKAPADLFLGKGSA